ncbi:MULTISPECIES: hypothetical protein [Isoptericola]|uniref:Universal stress protein family protein n=1 Tax=Isoptericola sediminis TaxID=2733572 RepID=A0A849KA42_9MICO|nr:MULTISPECIES: hypothetical protein [Isoptericola]MDO8145117.1 hypothetical protein [Isoptericola sp. 178]NNU28645.1 hypothetical protein [Isoptericola sediminis]
MSAEAWTVVVLSEDALTSADVDHITGLHTEMDAEIAYRVLVPADTEHRVVSSVLDHLGMLELREAWDDLIGKEPTPQQATATAAEQVTESVELFRDRGATASGEVTEDDPLPTLQRAVADGGDEVVVVTYPHAVEDTFHTDWASRARDVLQVPVLHLYAGTSELG